MTSKLLNKLLYVLIGLISIAFLVREAQQFGDFKVYLEAAKLISENKSPYNTWIPISEGHACLYFYSPLWAFMLTPFIDMPYFIPNFIWLVLNVFFLFRIFNILLSYIEDNNLTKKQKNWILFLTLLLSARFILYNFDLIQMTLFLLWGLLESWRLVRHSHFILGGMLLALVINIKIMPLVILPYLLCRGYFKGLISTLLFSLVFMFLPSIFTGWDDNLKLISDWWSAINPSRSEHLIESELGPHSLTALIPTLLLETSGELPYVRHFTTVSYETAIMILNITRVVLIALTLFFLKRPLFKPANHRIQELREMGYILLITPLIFPHQQKYEFVFAIPALFYIIFFIFQGHLNKTTTSTPTAWRFVILLVSLSFLLMTISTDGIIGKELNKITQHYKTITWGALLLVLAMIFTNSKSKTVSVPTRL